MGLIADARSIAARDPAAKSALQVFLLYPGFHILIFHRLAHFFYRHRRFMIARWISQTGRFWTGIEIHPGACLGKGLFIDHGSGIVIGETAEVGDDCTIYHGVTLGGTGKDKGRKRHPTIGDNVLIGAGAKVLGPITIGNCVMVGANSVVLHDVPDEATVVGVPGHVVRQQGKKHVPHNTELDHGSAPDPLEQEICRLMRRVSVLERAMSMSNGTDCSVLPGQVVKNEQKNNNNSNGMENNNVADEKDNKQEDFK
ncbi:MAG: serine O-acetyltransferase [Clostridiales bacterium]|jgi:serine O-acetyltransferase|nr:serine O-acetyltransferase [Clostridiales bacterium]